MGYTITARSLEIPEEQWKKLTNAQFHPLSLFFSLSRGGGARKPYYNIEFRLDGDNMKTLARALAFFFTMDDYGMRLYERILGHTETYVAAMNKMKELAWGNKYEEWREEQQKMFLEFCEQIDKQEEEMCAHYDEGMWPRP